MTVEETITLYRPVGRQELQLIRESGWRRFPPRLESQPIFYPVLSEEYAVKIARDWNTKDPNSDYEGFVLVFNVAKRHLDRYAPQVAGGSAHSEYWIPASELDEFNEHIVGRIELIHEFKGNRTHDAPSDTEPTS